MKIYNQIKDSIGISISYENIASSFLQEGDTRNALKYYKEALANSQILHPYEKMTILTNLGESYRQLNLIDSSIIYFNKSIKIGLSKEELKFPLAQSIGNLGMSYLSLRKLDSSEYYLDKSIKLLIPYKENYSISIFKAEKAKIYNTRKEYKKAEHIYHEALNLAKQDGLKEQIRDFNQLLSEFYTERKDYKKALHHQKQFQIYQDSLVNKENVRKIEQLKAGYEIDKRETQIGLLNKINSTQKKWVYSLALGVLSFLVLATLLFFSRKKVRKANTILAQQKEEISKREQEKAWLLRELNHRVKNNLQMVASLLNLQSNKLSGHPAQEAILIGKQRVEALSLVHRKLYQEGVDTRINIKDYITELILGLFHAYNANFKPDIKIGEEISVNIDSAIPLALIVNEIIINCLKYAYDGIENPELTVEITPLPDKHLSIHIFDNGIGFDENAEMKDSLGMKIITSLTRQLEGSVSHYNENGAHWQLNVLGK